MARCNCLADEADKNLAEARSWVHRDVLAHWQRLSANRPSGREVDRD